VIRGERVDTIVFPLRHEMAFHGILADHGIPVPAITQPSSWPVPGG
jgi:hypothetical protein